MEKINTDNYEAFFLDYHEGSLTPAQVAELFLFLEQHPELKEIFEGFENIALPGEEPAEKFAGKDALRKELITPANCETWFISDTEGLLNAAEKKELEHFLISHPEEIKTYRTYQKAKLQPELSETYEGKTALRKGSAFDPGASYNMIAALEGMLDAEEQNLFEQALKSNNTLRKEYGLYEAARLKPDLNLVYPGKEKLRRRRGVIIWLPAYTYIAAAASLALILMFWFFSPQTVSPVQNAELANQKKIKQDIPQNPVSEGLPKTELAQSKEENGKAKIRRTPGEHPPIQPPALSRNEETGVGMQALDVSPLNLPDVSNEKQLTLIRAFANEQVAETDASENPGSEFLNLRQFAARKLLSQQLADEYMKPTNRKHLGLAFAKSAASVFNRISGRKIRIRENYDSGGELVSYAINSGNFEYARAIKK